MVKQMKKSDGTIKYDSVVGTSGYYWVESETLSDNKDWKDIVDYDYYNSLVDAAIKSISNYGDYEMFCSPF